jgi:8-oxo-dGTP diphosphatase
MEGSKEGPLVGVGAVVVRDGALLMVRRAKDPARGLWSVPGGRLEHGETLAQAAAREVLEETGVEVLVGGLLGVFEVPGETHYVILDFLATATSDRNPAPAGDVSEARWVPFEEIPSLPCTPRLHETLEAWGIVTERASAEEQSD